VDIGKKETPSLMRLRKVSGALLLLVGCASHAAKDKDTEPVDRACTVSQCFSQRNIRSFEILDPTTLILYVGSQRCPFKVDLSGTFCDMTFATRLNFHKDELFARDPDIESTQDPARHFGEDRICARDLQVSVDGGVMTEGPTHPTDPAQRTDRFGNRVSKCQLQNVQSLTDDGLVELLVKRGVAPPPPPIGKGEIKVEGPQEHPASPPPANAGHASTNR
jgi:hypothetical protein